jgi:gluconolactonase
MCLDAEGNIVACGGSERSGPGPMIYVFSPTGQVLETHPTPAEATNCAFGGPNLADLYVTTTEGHLYRVNDTGRQGWVLYPQAG